MPTGQSLSKEKIGARMGPTRKSPSQPLSVDHPKAWCFCKASPQMSYFGQVASCCSVKVIRLPVSLLVLSFLTSLTLTALVRAPPSEAFTRNLCSKLRSVEKPGSSNVNSINPNFLNSNYVPSTA